MSIPGKIVYALALLVLTLGPARLLLAQEPAASTEAKVQDEQQLPLELHELPWDLRRDLPPIKVTVRHAPSDPNLRFVKINGERFAQGDSLGIGPTIVEIRTDGVILEFQGQRLIIR